MKRTQIDHPKGGLDRIDMSALEVDFKVGAVQLKRRRTYLKIDAEEEH